MPLTDLTGGTDTNNAGGGMSSAGVGGGAHAPVHNQPDPTDMLINYNERFKTAGTILFRDTVIKQTVSTLICKQKPNPLLIGQAGVGKTKIVEDIAYRLANDDMLIPDQLKGFTVYELPLVNIVSGSSFLGELEQKLTAVINFISEPKNKAILFIDEIHLVCDSSNGSYEKIAQILKPALARGNFRCIGSTTLQESTTLLKDPAFNRRYSRVIVDELSQSQTVEILRHSLNGYLKHYNSRFSISDDTLAAVVPIADQYTNIGSHRPDNALTLLDRSIATCILNRKVKEVELLEQSKDASDPVKQQAALTALQALKSSPVVNITENKIRDIAVKLMKGNSERDIVDFDALRDALKDIKGQDDVIEKVLKIIKTRESGLFPSKKPVTMLFAGTSGVGKTEITKIIAEHITGKAPIVLNMTEYAHSSAINQIIGSNIGYVGSDSKIELPFDCLESNPYQFILLDEFEKGNREVQRLFMRVFDEGILKTNRGTTIDFSKAIIIATTNAGNKQVKNKLGFGELAKSTEQTAVAELKKWFDTELINRFEHIINFNSITVDDYIDIIQNLYAKEIARIRATNRSIALNDTIDDETLETLRKEFIPDLGARPAMRKVRDYIESQL